MSNIIPEKLEFIKNHCHKILDLGAGADYNLKNIFRSNEYKTLDIEKSSGADFIADAHHLPLPDNSTDAVLAFSLIEHTHSPHVVAKEIERVLKPGGYLLLSTPFIHPYHGGRCPDYYRFSKDG